MSNILFQLQFSERTKEYLVNPGLEVWSGGTPTGWNVVTGGTSTVTQETVNLRPGTSGLSAVRFTYDATPGAARINQTITAKKETWVYYKFWYRCQTYSASQNFGILITNSGTNVYLADDKKTWTTTLNSIQIPSCDRWTYFEMMFKLHPDYADYIISWGNGNTITSNYVIVDDIDLRLDTTFVSMSGGEINGAQYLPDIMNSPIEVKRSLAKRGKLENSSIVLQLNDQEITVESVTYRKYRKILSENNDIKGRGAIAWDESGNKLGQYKITNIGPQQIGLIQVELSDAFSELSDNSVPGIITEERFPDAPPASIGKYINHFSGQFMVTSSTDAGKKNYVIAYRIFDNGPTTPARYLIGKSIQNIVDFSGTQDFQYVTDEEDVIILASKCSLIIPTATDEYHYIDIIAAEPNHDYVKVHFKYPAISSDEVVGEIGDLFFADWPFDVSNLSILPVRNYNVHNGGYQDRRDPRFLIESDMKYVDILNQICESFNVSYVIDEEGNIIFQYFDTWAYESGITETIQDEIAELFELMGQGNPYENITNRLSIEWGYDGTGSNANEMIFNQRESQVANNTIRNDSISANLFPSNYSVSKRYAHFTARQWMIEDFYGQDSYTFKILNIYDLVNSTQTMSDILVIGMIFKFKHDSLKTPDDYYYMLIKSVRRVYPGDYAIVEFIDVSSVIDVDNNSVLLLQSNSDNNSLIVLDHAPNGFHIISNNGNQVIHSTDYPLFSRTSFKNSGSTPDLQIAVFNEYNDMQIFSALGDDSKYSALMSVWVRFNATGNQECIIGQYTSATAYWCLLKTTGDKIRLIVVTGGVTRLNLLSTSSVADGKWHHVAFYRTDAIAGLYVDGQQEANSTATLDYPFFAIWHAFNDGNSANYMNGNIQDVYIAMNGEAFPASREKGWFNMNPNVGNTDTYIVPYGLHSVFWQRYWVDFK